MTSKEKLINIIENLNENGVNDLLFIIDGISDRERYNINTTPERLEELDRIEKEKEEKRSKDKKDVEYELAKAMYKKSKEYKASLTGKEKRLFEVINSVKMNTRYEMEVWETLLIADVYGNNLINGYYDVFRYGYLKGQRAEKAKNRRVL